MKAFALLVMVLLCACNAPVDVREGSPGEPGRDGAEGPQGPRGERGYAGPQGDCADTYTATGQLEVAPGSVASAEAQCDEGDTVIGGGCEWGKVPGDVEPFATRPAGENAWHCAGTAVAQGATYITAYAICAAQ